MDCPAVFIKNLRYHLKKSQILVEFFTVHLLQSRLRKAYRAQHEKRAKKLSNCREMYQRLNYTGSNPKKGGVDACKEESEEIRQEKNSQKGRQEKDRKEGQKGP
jgi:hypothetical protein